MWVHLDSPASRNQECDDIRFFRMHVLGGYYPSRSSGRRSHSLLPAAPVVYFFRFSCQMNTLSIHHTYIHWVRFLSPIYSLVPPARGFLLPLSHLQLSPSSIPLSCRTPWLSFLWTPTEAYLRSTNLAGDACYNGGRLRRRKNNFKRLDEGGSNVLVSFFFFGIWPFCLHQWRLVVLRIPILNQHPTRLRTAMLGTVCSCDQFLNANKIFI